MNLAPQIETAEMSDADLDDVSGGQAGGFPAGAGATGFYVEGGPLGVGGGIGAAVSPEGIAVDSHLNAATLY
jgi:hypothetical protein